MSIRLKIEVCKKEGTDNYGSIGAVCAIDFEIDQSVLADPAVFVAKVREQFAMAEAAVKDELGRLKAKPDANGHATTAGPNPPAKRPVANPPVKQTAPVAKAKDYGDAHEPEEDDDPPTDGRNLLGWAHSQPEDAKNWLVGFGKRARYPGRILDWTPKQVETAYQTYRAAQRS